MLAIYIAATLVNLNYIVIHLNFIMSANLEILPSLGSLLVIFSRTENSMEGLSDRRSICNSHHMHPIALNHVAMT